MQGNTWLNLLIQWTSRNVKVHKLVKSHLVTQPAKQRGNHRSANAQLMGLDSCTGPVPCLSNTGAQSCHAATANPEPEPTGDPVPWSAAPSTAIQELQGVPGKLLSHTPLWGTVPQPHKGMVHSWVSRGLATSAAFDRTGFTQFPVRGSFGRSIISWTLMVANKEIPGQARHMQRPTF